MRTLKRLFVTVKSQIDCAADQFENHEALANAAIKDLQRIGAKTTIQFRHLQEMSARLQQKLNTLVMDSERWADRALAARTEDEKRAMECVRRLRQIKAQIAQTEQQLNESRRVEAQVKADLEKVQDRLQLLKKKKELLAARQNRSDVMATLERGNVFSCADIQDVFTRWEDSVVGAEFQFNDRLEEDGFAAEFEHAEDELELKSMLDELSRKASGDETTKSSGEQS